MSNFKAWICGEKTNISVTENGELLTAVEIGGVIVEAPGVNTETDVLNDKIINPATTTNFVFSNVSTGYSYTIVNDGSVDVTYNINSTGVMSIKAGETIREDFVKFTTLRMINSTTTSCSVRARVSGV